MRSAGSELFRQVLDRLAPEGRIGLAVSGGPDSVALLLLAAEARPGLVEAATVDHGLRPGSADEAAMVAEVCGDLRVPHRLLRAELHAGGNLQARAREVRYELLTGWLRERALPCLATGHHADDQAETLLMRLARGSGLGGLSGVRERLPLASGLTLVRPLLGWRKAELEEVTRAAGLVPATDPSNDDPRHDRTRFRALLERAEWLDPRRLARSAAALGEAEEAFGFVVEGLAAERIVAEGDGLSVAAGDLPAELQRRLLVAALAQLGLGPARGPDLDRALNRLRHGESCTLAGAKLTAGERWRVAPAPPRRA